MRVLVCGGIVVVWHTFFVLLFPSIEPPPQMPYDYTNVHILVCKKKRVMIDICRYIEMFHV